jgi:hypothetical protein
MRLLFAVGFVLVSGLSAQAGELDAGQIRAELIGNSIAWWENDGWYSGDLMLLPDGRAMLTVSAPEKAKDVGKWALRGNEICTEWSSMRNRAAKCYTVQKLEDRKFLTSGGNVFTLPVAGV